MKGLLQTIKLQPNEAHGFPLLVYYISHMGYANLDTSMRSVLKCAKCTSICSFFGSHSYLVFRNLILLGFNFRSRIQTSQLTSCLYCCRKVLEIGVLTWSLATALVPVLAGFMPGLILSRILVKLQFKPFPSISVILVECTMAQSVFHRYRGFVCAIDISCAQTCIERFILVPLSFKLPTVPLKDKFITFSVFSVEICDVFTTVSTVQPRTLAQLFLFGLLFC